MTRPGLAAAILLLGSFPASAQTVQNTCVEVSATVQSAPPQIVFSWPGDATSTGYTIYRRAPGAAAWGAAVASLGAGATTWTDTTVAVGVAYEYRFDKTGLPAGRGLIQAGIEVPAVHSRGKVILVVADNHAAYLAAELERLKKDLVGDGWQVIRRDVAITATVAQVKAVIAADFAADPANVKAVFIFGDVAVPYSGNTNWDGHADHAGAWPCDGFYGEMNGTWTDTVVNTTVPARPENDNVPGDGKYDQSTFPSAVELAVGRVDLANMPAFALAERDLLKAYLDKNNAYRHKVIACQERGVIDDHFGYFGGEAFAAGGWRNFAPMFGAAANVASDYFTELNTPTGPGWLWSYGCGAGTYTSAGGVGSTTTFTASTNRNIFTMLFGSYHGDWDSTNNFLRAPLGSGWTLTSAWSGRPTWSFHPMALGQTIGYCTRYSMNDTAPLTGCHMGLMGDPTLRQHVVAPGSNLSAIAGGSGITLSWTASADAVLGYHVYRSSVEEGPYTLLNAVPVAATSYLDASAPLGTSHYLVRAVTLQVAASGSYYNLSQGLWVAAAFTGASGGGGGGGGGCGSTNGSGPGPWLFLGLLVTLAVRLR